MFGTGDMHKLLGGEETEAGQKETESTTLQRPKIHKFVPKIDKSKETYIHRRRKKEKGKSSKTSSSRTATEAELFKDDSESDSSSEAEAQQVRKEPALEQEDIKGQADEDEDEDEDEEIIEARRKLIRKRLLERQREQEEQEDKEEKHNVPESEDDSDDEAMLAVRRMKIKERLLQRRSGDDEVATSDQLEKEPPKNAEVKTQVSEISKVEVNEASSSSSSSSESSSDSSSDSEEEDAPVQLKFVPRGKRQTIINAKEEEKKEQQRLKLQKEAKEEKVRQTKTQVAEEVKRNRIEDEEKAKKSNIAYTDARTGMPDDTDGLDEKAEYEAWKLRELARLKRDLEEKHNIELEKAEIEKRRNMTDEERAKHDEELIRKGIKKGEVEKKQLQFMQRYYHKGAFYIDEDTIKKQEKISGKEDVRRKDYNEATGSDRKNMELLPGVLQTKKFGKKGQTKWTHLTNEDTSKGDNLFAEGDYLRSQRKNKR